MGDKYDAMLAAYDSQQATPASSPQGDKYDQMIASVGGPETGPQNNPTAPANADFEVKATDGNPGAQTPAYIPASILQPSDSAQFNMGVHPITALLTNNPVGYVDNTIRGIPAMIGGAIGGGAGAVAGGPGAVATSILGYGLGSAGGEGLRQAAVGVYAGNTGDQIPSPSQVGSAMAVQGALGAGTQTIAEGAKAALPFLKKATAGAMRIGPNIPTAEGEAVLSDPGILTRAASPQEMTAQYKSFEDANGLVSPRMARAENGQLVFEPADATKTVNRTYQRMLDYQKWPGEITPPSNQELYEGSQAGAFLGRMAKMANPNQAANAGNISMAKDAFDSALEAATEDGGFSYKQLRQNNFESKIAQKFYSPYPQNNNGEPNVLRSLAAAQTGATVGGAAGYGIAGAPGAALGYVAGGLLGPAAVSPAIAGLGVRALGAIQPALPAIAGGLRTIPAAAGGYLIQNHDGTANAAMSQESIAAFYRSPGQ